MNRKRLTRYLLRPALLLLPLLISGCVEWDSPQSALDPKGPVAQNQYDAFMVTLYVTTFLWVTVGGTLLYAVWRFRQRKHEDPNVLPKQSHGHPLVEAGLIVFSALCLVIIAVPTLKGIVFMNSVPEEYDREDAIVINATGFQWWWEFEYPNESLTTANEIVVPVGRPVKVQLRSADVIHSFWLPKLAGKVDLVPGQVNFIWFQADEPGVYYGQCAEFCGDSHAYMLFRTRAVSDAEYDQWLEQQKAPAQVPLRATPDQVAELAQDHQLVAAGQAAFMKNCFSCHKIDNEGGATGPNLTHLMSRGTLAAGWLENTPENLYRWIRTPHQVKPGNYMWEGVPLPGIGVMEGLKMKDLSDDEVRSIVAYLSLLK